MSPETIKHIKKFCKDVIETCDFLKTTDMDQFTVMRIALMHSLASSIDKYLEV